MIRCMLIFSLLKLCRVNLIIGESSTITDGQYIAIIQILKVYSLSFSVMA